MKLQIDVRLHTDRIKRLYDFWESDAVLKGLNAIAFSLGSNEVLTYNKTSALQEWFFGYELNDTLTVITKNKIFIVTSKKKADFLEPIKRNNAVQYEIKIKTEDNSDNFKEIKKFITNGREVNAIGVFEKDKFEGEFIEYWYSLLNSSDFKRVDVSSSFASLFSVKDETEIAFTKKACGLCSDLYSRYVKSLIVDIIDVEKKIKHSDLSEKIENELESKKLIPSDMSMDDIDVSFPPIIQSGGRYNLKFSSISDDHPMEYDCILSYIGIRYKYYCSSLVRTLMVQPDEELKKIYTFLFNLHESLLSKIKRGVVFKQVCNYIHDEVRSAYPQFFNNFVRNVGFVTGLEFRESLLVIDSKNESTFKDSMVVCTLVGFQNISLDGSKKPVSLAIGDTVLLEGDSVQCLTYPKKILNSSLIILNENYSSEDEIDEEMLKKASKIMENKKRQNQAVFNNSEDKRKAHQAELKKKLNEEAKRRLLMSEESLDKRINEASFPKSASYKSPTSLPKESDVFNLKIFVDKSCDSIILPVFGMAVPFHISTIKSVSSNVEGNFTYLRLNFNTVISSSNKGEDLSISYGKNVYVKEMIYRSSNSRDSTDMSTNSSNLTSCFNMIKDMQKNYKSRVSEELEMEGVIKQDDLVLNTLKNVPRLKDLSIRPPLSNRRISGVLEAHTNGFRYSTGRGENVDILYKNIRHAIFQPCDGEIVITIHLNLISPIIIGKKKYRDIQFYTEIGEVTSDLAKINSNMLDRDEIEAEQQEREARNKLKLVFKTFIQRIESITNNELEFEIPIRELGFQGVPFKSSVSLYPTTHCLVSIVDQPVYIISLDEIELVHFERVVFHMKQFDMVIIFKNYQKKVSTISCIPMTYLEAIKDWLNSCDIKYTETAQNLNWVKIMKTILDDPEDFFANGGWSFLDPESSEHEDLPEEDEDQEYRPDASSEDLAQESASDSEDYESESSESDAEEDFSEDTETGKSWSELEEEARAVDAMRHGEHHSSTSGKRKIPSKRQSIESRGHGAKRARR